MARSSRCRNGERSWAIGVSCMIGTGESGGTGGSSDGFSACSSSRGDIEPSWPRIATRNYSSSTKRRGWQPVTVLARSASGPGTTNTVMPGPELTSSHQHPNGRLPLTSMSTYIATGSTQHSQMHTFTAPLDDLPDGVFITLEERQDQPLLVQGDSLLIWSPGGYRERIQRKTASIVSVLTPASSVSTIRAGFEPGVHYSATAP